MAPALNFEELFQRIADELGGRGMTRGVIVNDLHEVLYSTRDNYFSPNLFNRTANDRFLRDIERLMLLVEQQRDEPLQPMLFELGGDIYELHVEDGDNKHMYGVCENPMYHVYAHLAGPIKFIVFCPDPSTSYPPLLAAVNKIAAEANADA